MFGCGVGIMLAAAGRAQGEALVGPLVLRGVAPGDGFDACAECAGRNQRVGIGDLRRRRFHVQSKRQVRPNAFTPGVQNGGTGALGQAVDQRHGQRLHTKERHKDAVAILGLLVGQNTGSTAVLEYLEQLPHRRAFCTHLAHIVTATHQLQEFVADRVLRWRIDDGNRPA